MMSKESQDRPVMYLSAQESLSQTEELDRPNEEKKVKLARHEKLIWRTRLGCRQVFI